MPFHTTAPLSTTVYLQQDRGDREARWRGSAARLCRPPGMFRKTVLMGAPETKMIRRPAEGAKGVYKRCCLPMNSVPMQVLAALRATTAFVGHSIRPSATPSFPSPAGVPCCQSCQRNVAFAIPSRERARSVGESDETLRRGVATNSPPSTESLTVIDSRDTGDAISKVGQNQSSC